MSVNERTLAGKTTLVTGAGRGIGYSIAVAFARAGADVAICARSADELASASELIKAQGVRCVVGVADLTNETQTKQFCTKALAEFGKLDVLVNNAGGMLETAKIADSDITQWWRTIEVNLKVPFLVTRLLMDGLADGAKIINLSTGVALRAGNQNSAYHVAKAGLHMFTEALANELQHRGIEANNLIPGSCCYQYF